MSSLLLMRRPLCPKYLSLRLSQARRYALIGKPKQQSEPVWALPKTPARTRFAPSPTGYLHLGSLRTALFNFLLAQATGGQFVIRLEDTDQARLVADSESRLYQDLAWAGLAWDEGPDKGGPFGPYKQSERLRLYKQHADALLEGGHAFRCFCMRKDLEFNIKEVTATGSAAHYPGTCMSIGKSESDRRAANGEPHTIRFKAAEEPVSASDLVYGAYKKNEREDNFIIMKSDGYPTYHFANVVDDHFMEITHVIRGAEWLISTPKHVELYNAFGWHPPNFAHVGLLVDAQRQKLSKRDIDNIGIDVYRTNKVMPEALLNFSVLLGWDPNLQRNPHLNKQGLMTLDDMRKNFTLKFTRGDIVVDQAKLKFFHTKMTRGLVSGEIEDPEALHKSIIKPMLTELQKIDAKLQAYRRRQDSVAEEWHNLFERIAKRKPHPEALTEGYIHRVLKSWKGSVDDPVQFVYDNIHAFYPISKATLRKSFLQLQKDKARISLRKNQRSLVNTDFSNVIMFFKAKLKKIIDGGASDWHEEVLGPAVKELVSGVKYFDVAKHKLIDQSAGWMFLRWALLNGRSGLSIVPMMTVLGPQETSRRLREARKAAVGEEEKLELARRKAEAGFVRTVRVTRPSVDQKADQGPDSRMEATEIEARNVRVQEKPQKNGGEGSPEQRNQPKGPFVSRQPNLHSVSAKRSPDMVERTPRPLRLDEWKTGTRRLDLGNKPDTYAPAPWEFEAGQRQSPTATAAVGRASPGQAEEPRTPLEQPAQETAVPFYPKGVMARGPFLPAKAEPLPDYAAHVDHIRVSNTAAKLGRMSSDPDGAVRTKAERKEAAKQRKKATKQRRMNSKSGRLEGELKASLLRDLPHKDEAVGASIQDPELSRASYIEATNRESRARGKVARADASSMDDIERRLAAISKRSQKHQW